MPQKFPKGVILVWLGFLLLLGSIVCVGLYYFLEVYSPEKYTKNIVTYFQKIGSPGVVSGKPTGGNTYEDVLVSLDEYKEVFTQINNDLAKNKPIAINILPSIFPNSNRSYQIHKDLMKIIDIFLVNIENAKKKAKFMITARDLLVTLRPDLSTYPPPAVPAGQGVPLPPPPSTASEYLAVWEARVPKAISLAQELFKEPQDLGEVSYDELKKLWLETEQGLEALIPFLKKQDPNLTISELQKLVPENEKIIYDKVDRIDEFRPLLEKVLIRYSPDNLLMFQNIMDSRNKEEFDLTARRLEAALKGIEAK